MEKHFFYIYYMFCRLMSVTSYLNVNESFSMTTRVALY